MTHLKHAVASAILLAWSAAPTVAMTPQQEAAFRDACSGDYLRFCAMHAPEDPKVEQCFKAKMAELSGQCRTLINSFSRTNPSGRR